MREFLLTVVVHKGKSSSDNLESVQVYASTQGDIQTISSLCIHVLAIEASGFCIWTP
jgi:hypothetical protein